jgi:hypothetical protein
LQELVEVLDTHPEVALAYPLNRKIGPSGEVLARRAWVFDTFGVTDTWKRLTLSMRQMSAGNMVYGLYRVSLLAKAGVYRRVLVPDRLLMTELAVYGQFRQVPEVLWFRRWYGPIFSLSRQRKSFFPRGRPLYMYAPWWISHGVSLFWTFGIQREGMPAVTRGAGMRLGLKYLVFSGLFHLWQQLRALRIELLGRLSGLKPHERRLRLVAREIHRRGVLDWTGNRLKPYVGAKARKKAVSRLKNRARQTTVETVGKPAFGMLRKLRAIPLIQRRIVPSLLRQEIDQLPESPIVSAMEREFHRLQRTTGPILVGPWISEVGFELLYWIPFLNWAIKANALDQRRLVMVSRGGAHLWYQHLAGEYIDVFDMFTVTEYRARNEERWSDAGHQKQFAITAMDREILERTRRRLGVEDLQLLHPSLMYKLLRFFWFEKASVRLLTQHAEYRRLSMGDHAPLAGLPRDYVAVRFYFRPSFPDTPENRRFASDAIRQISREIPVVLLNTGLSLDDHEDVDVADAHDVHRIGHLMTPHANLDVQTRVISQARAFVGTYGGLAYLAPFLGVPSVGFYSTPSELIPAHLDVGWRLGRAMGAPLTPLDSGSVGVLRMMLGLAGEKDGLLSDVTTLPAASAGPR